MKPSFALNLSHDGIGLLHRTPTGWEILGEVSLDAPNLSEELGRLRRLAEACAPATGVLTKLIIPASQILYAEIAAPGPRPAMRRRQISAALEGMTPYEVQDLAFDWSGRGEQVQVAIVARDTLAEAESFAEDWGFCPVGFVAVPAPGTFAGEPWFGLSSGAGRYLPEGTRLDRDQDPVPLTTAPHALPSEQVPALEPVVAETVTPASGEVAPVAEAAVPEAVPVDEAPAPAETTTIPEAASATSDVSVAEEAVADEAEVAPETLADATAETLAEAISAELSDMPADLAPEPPEEAEPLLAEPSPAPAAATTAAAEEVDGEIDDPEALADLERALNGPLAPEERTEAEDGADALPLAEDGHPAEVEPALAPLDEVPEEEAAELAAEEGPAESDTLAVAAALAASEASAIEVTSGALDTPDEEAEAVVAEDAAEDETAAETADAAEDAPATTGGEQSETAPDEAGTVDEAAAEPEEAPIASPSDDAPAEDAETTAAAEEETPEEAPQPGEAPRAARIPSLAGVARGTVPSRPLGGALRTAGVTAPGLDLPEDEAAPVLAAPRKPQRSRKTAKTAPVEPTPAPPETTVFGARRRKQVGGKPRHLGVTLMAALVIFLGLVAIWASYLDAPRLQLATAPSADAPPAPDLGTPMQGLTEAPADAAPETVPAEATDTPSPADEAASDMEADADLAGVDAEMAADGVAPDALAAADAPDPTLSSAQMPAEPATDAQDAAPAEPRTEEATAVAAAAPETAAPGAPAGAVLAPAAPQADAQPAVPAAPPPFEDLARVAPGATFEPTPEGVVTPGGFTLYSGRPPRVSRARPAAVTQAAIAAEEAAAMPWADPTLKRFKPKTRPATVERAAEAAAAAPPAEPAPAAAPTTAPETVEAAPEPAAPLSPEEQRLAAQRPSARPNAVLRSAEMAAAEAEAEAAKAEAEAKAATAAVADATPQAVSVSRRPTARPHSFKTSVEQALALAIASEPEPVVVAAAPAPAPAPVAAPAPQKAAPAPQRTVASAPEPAVELDEPEPTMPTRNMPTSASVAKQATEQNALALREMNLIGVYGASGNRRALVRMPNGRFVKVSVGDRLDGGKVTAIGDGQLTYQKGSRTLMLKMLKGS